MVDCGRRKFRALLLLLLLLLLRWRRLGVLLPLHLPLLLGAAN